MTDLVSGVEAAQAFGVVPLDAQAGLQALMQSGVGTIIQFGLLVFTVVLSIAALFKIGMAGVNRMSQDAGRQGKVGGDLSDAAYMLVVAVVLGAGPEVLTALGFRTFQYISPVSVFAG